MLKILDKIIFLISLIAIFGLLGAYTASYINPNSFVWPSLLGLAYPYLLITNILLLLYWITRWKKTAWLLLFVILLGFSTFRTYYGTAGSQDQEGHADLSILSYNIRYFDIYSWTNQKDTREKLFNYLNKFPGDIICLQEFLMNSDPRQQQSIVRNLHSYPYHYIYKDMAIFSRIPMIRKAYIPFHSKYSGSGIYCDFPIGNDTVRVYSIHLESYKLGQKERQFMKDISEGLKSDDISGGVKNLTTRLTTANKNRAVQAEQINRHVKQSPYKVILCGDFNDTPLSYTYRMISKGLTDSFIEKGRGIGNTYIGEFPSFRIDYILHTPGIETVSYTRDNITLSDHYPIKAKIKLQTKE